MKTILDLCGGTGSWSRPWKEAGYKVYNITLPEIDVTKVLLYCSKSGGEADTLGFHGETDGMVYLPKISDIYGILAAPPCTEFSIAKYFHGKGRYTHNFVEGMRVVKSCMEIIWACQIYGHLKFWALENPATGLLDRFMGKPCYTFDAWEFGDAYQKRTALWGYFKEPKKTVTEKPKGITKFSMLKSRDIAPEYYGTFDRQTRRAITPRGFAEAFYRANRQS
jgi:hypothetical protein